MSKNKVSDDFQNRGEQGAQSKKEHQSQLSGQWQLKPVLQKKSQHTETLGDNWFSLERALMDWLWPNIHDKLILTPSRYQNLLYEARSAMAMQAQQSEALAKGAELLAWEQEIRQLLNIQRTLLMGV